jgi:hypothetical protein
MGAKKKDLSFQTFVPAKPVQTTAHVDRVAANVKRLVVDVSPAIHRQLVERCIPFDTIKAYVLFIVNKQQHRAKVSPNPIPPMRGQKRIIIELPEAEADALTEKAKSFQSFREFVLRCLEAEGLDIGGKRSA